SLVRIWLKAYLSDALFAFGKRGELMDSNILAATIGVIGGFLASLLLFYLNRFYTNYDKRKSEKILREKLLYREKDSELEADQNFIFSLPDLKRGVFKLSYQLG